MIVPVDSKIKRKYHRDFVGGTKIKVILLYICLCNQNYITTNIIIPLVIYIRFSMIINQC